MDLFKGPVTRRHDGTDVAHLVLKTGQPAVVHGPLHILHMVPINRHLFGPLFLGQGFERAGVA